MKLENIHSVFFLGIGGIGMSALALWFHHQGVAVSGYDLTASALTAKLQNAGIQIQYEDNVKALPKEIVYEKETSIIVYTPAIPSGNQLLKFFKENNYALHKRSVVLGMITESSPTIAVAGTHGKTTTSAAIACLLHHSGKSANAFIGGVMTNYDTNLLVGEPSDWTVVEADEYDRSFLTLRPDIAIITSIDADHLDIYGDLAAMRRSFEDFIHQIKPNGVLILHEKLANRLQVRSDIEVLTYGFQTGATHAENMQLDSEGMKFDLVGNYTLADVRTLVAGVHNLENLIAAILAMKSLQLGDDEIQAGVRSFLGVKRRFEFILRTENSVYIDDYAHHPVEIEAFLRSVKMMYPEKKITAIFQPHLFSRTQDFYREFGQSLSLADEVILLEIYPAREQQIPGVTSQLILEQISHGHKRLVAKSMLIQELAKSQVEVCVTMGAGDIDRMVNEIKNSLLNPSSHVC